MASRSTLECFALLSTGGSCGSTQNVVCRYQLVVNTYVLSRSANVIVVQLICRFLEGNGEFSSGEVEEIVFVTSHFILFRRRCGVFAFLVCLI